ncbi:molybdate ABC transporter substrate-binding protein [Arthrobacter sp. NIO-1057]|uniref:molybdate ABC transporter substrate-binding protein n=1 Tax=Arthrobacter sp. NIO-1057 TaxID=993071 RepID=UPI00071CA7F2|nr:molybdate ABC transporter substrate-binding protein [Arthrobacter sp. NIO-1057]KSU65706.1 molybdate-binding protein [Arthrobacter sp. NIO-1057]SCC41059.1 molybdate transport system substrate-binding protein [Arthrobacter sp. NIO-1057]
MRVSWPRAARLLLAGTAATLAFSGCTSDQPAQQESITVSAAASLHGAFEQIAKEFQAEHPEVKIAGINYDGSSSLATQIVEGAEVDVFASADEANMATVTEAGFGHEPVIFASNTLVIAVPKDNPANIKSLEDLAGANTVLCASQVPCGNASAQLLENASVSVKPVSEEQNVSAVVQKVAAGEADAGLVYATDVQDDEQLAAIVPEGADEVVNSYPIATLTDQAGAQEFVDFVIGERGQAILTDYGFGSGAAQGNG